MEVREKKEMSKQNRSANLLTPYTYPQTADKRNGSDPDPDPDPDVDTNPISVAPAPRSYARPQASSPTRSVRYRECQRNHAASSGGHVVDGCGEFMPSGGEESLLCAACDCHRSFHRKEIDGIDRLLAATCLRS
ncbi:unnamed protein product [Arabis nemorensis]|uniref:ZF-HD dimerization-type domain-containing protein n=1 Tax=Arabis nemorensis TaxID=586526 RepID=A0A565BCZ6_9BRAS|nr:unnamed protein product [Arabis nemorensis]